MSRSTSLKLGFFIFSIAVLVGYAGARWTSAMETALCPVPQITSVTPVEVSMDLLANTRFTLTGAGFKGSGCLPPAPGTDAITNQTVISVQGPITPASAGLTLQVFTADSTTVSDTSLTFNITPMAGTAINWIAGTYQATVTTAGGKSNLSRFFLFASVSPTPAPTLTPQPSTCASVTCPLSPVQEGCFYDGKTECTCGTLVCPTPGPSPTPIMCTQEYFPICGADGLTYPNECYLKAAGTKLAYFGVCGACATSAAYACPPTPPGCQYVKTTTTGDACSCGTVVCTDASPTPKPSPTPTPIPYVCREVAGYTSACWSDGKRVINVSNPRTEANTVKFTVVVTMPLTANVNAIWNRAHYWSKSQNKWVAATLVGAKYPGAAFNTAGEGYITGTGGTSLSVPTADATNGSVYVVSWDYTWQNNAWAGPKSSSCTDTRGCWRMETVPVPPSI